MAYFSQVLNLTPSQKLVILQRKNAEMKVVIELGGKPHGSATNQRWSLHHPHLLENSKGEGVPPCNI